MANDILVKIGADISDFSRKMAESSRALSNFSKASQQTFDSFKQVGTAVTGAGVAIAGGLGVAAKHAIDFESSFAGVRKTVDTSEEGFKRLEKGIRDMAKELPASANDIAAVAEAAGQLGIAEENILSFTRTIIDLGESTNLSAEQGATEFARFANIVGMSQENFDRLGSSIVALGNSMATTEAEIMSMAMRLAAQGSQVGMTEAQILALAGTMSSLGIQAEMGGTAMTTILKKIQSAVAAGGKDLEDFASAAHMSSEEFKKLFESDAIMGLDALVKGLAKSSEEGEVLSEILTDLGMKGIYESDVMQRLVGATDLLSEAVTTSSNAWEENTALSNEAAQRYETMASKLAILKNTLIDAGISIGQALMPAIGKVTEFIKNLVEKFNGLSEGTKQFIAISAAVVTALMLIVGPILLLIGFIPQIIAGFTTIVTVVKSVIGFFGMLAGAVSLPVALITAAVVGLALIIYKYWDEIKAFMKATWDAIVEAAIAVWEWIKDVWNSAVEAFSEIFAPLVEIMSEVWENIKVAAEAAWKLIKNVVLGPILLLIDLVTGNFDEMGSHLSQIWKNITGAAKTIWNSLIGIFSKVWDAIKQVFYNALQWLDNKTGGKFSDIIKVVSEYMGMAFGIIEDIWGFIKRSFSNALEFIKGLVTLDFGRMWNAIKDQMGNILETISSVWNRIKSFFSGNLSEILSNLKGKFTEMVSAVRGKMSEISDKIEELMKKAIDYLKGINLMQVGKDIIQGLINGIGSMAKAVWDKAKDIATGIGDSIKKTLGIKSPSRVLMEIGKWTTIGLAEGIKDYAYLIDKASDLIAESAIPDVKNIDMSYATPDGVKAIMSAINGTVEVRGKHSQGITQNITIVSPDATSPAENARQIKKAQRELAMEWGM